MKSDVFFQRRFSVLFGFRVKPRWSHVQPRRGRVQPRPRCVQQRRFPIPCSSNFLFPIQPRPSRFVFRRTKPCPRSVQGRRFPDSAFNQDQAVLFFEGRSCVQPRRGRVQQRPRCVQRRRFPIPRSTNFRIRVQPRPSRFVFRRTKPCSIKTKPWLTQMRPYSTKTKMCAGTAFSESAFNQFPNLDSTKTKPFCFSKDEAVFDHSAFN